MLDKLDAIKARFDEIGVALTNPEIIADNKKFGVLSKEYRSLEKVVRAYDDYRKLLDDVEFYREALNGNDPEMRELAKAELPEAEEKLTKMEDQLQETHKGQTLIKEEVTHEDIAAVVSYIRNAWGNRASLITTAQIDKSREGTH